MSKVEKAFKQLDSLILKTAGRIEFDAGEGYATVKRPTLKLFKTIFPKCGRVSIGRYDTKTKVCLWWVDITGFDVQYTGTSEESFLRDVKEILNGKR